MYLVIPGYVITEDRLIPINSDEYKKLINKLHGDKSCH